MAEKEGKGGAGLESFDPATGKYISDAKASSLFGVKDPNYEDIKTTPGAIKQIGLSDVKSAMAKHPDAPKNFFVAAYNRISDYEAVEPKITKDIIGLADKYGGVPSGLDFRLKTLDSTISRMKKNSAGHPNPNPLKALYGVKDSLRYTLCFNDSDFDSVVPRVVSDITGKYHLARVLNTMHPGSLYKGINCLFTDDSGHIFELQFHTPESLKAKDGFIVDMDSKTIKKDKGLKTSHDYYEHIRDVKTRAKNGTATPEEITESKAMNSKLYDLWKDVPDHYGLDLFRYARS